MSATVLAPVRATFRAVAATVVPETVALDPAGWATLEAAVERSIATRPEGLRKQLALFVRLIEYFPLLTERGRFSRLGPEARFRVLKALERAPLLPVRRGMWGLRTLVLLGYYTQPQVQAAIGYRAHADGWSLRRRSGEHPAVVPTSTSAS